MSRILIAFIRLYQYGVSPLIGPHCRFTPSCSQYASEAFKKYGFARATYLSITRICRCHPWRPGGYDPLP